MIYELTNIEKVTVILRYDADDFEENYLIARLNVSNILVDQ